jgi:hypothetical protein
MVNRSVDDPDWREAAIQRLRTQSAEIWAQVPVPHDGYADGGRDFPDALWCAAASSGAFGVQTVLAAAVRQRRLAEGLEQTLITGLLGAVPGDQRNAMRHAAENMAHSLGGRVSEHLVTLLRACSAYRLPEVPDTIERISGTGYDWSDSSDAARWFPELLDPAYTDDDDWEP